MIQDSLCVAHEHVVGKDESDALFRGAAADAVQVVVRPLEGRVRGLELVREHLARLPAVLVDQEAVLVVEHRVACAEDALLVELWLSRVAQIVYVGSRVVDVVLGDEEELAGAEEHEVLDVVLDRERLALRAEVYGVEAALVKAEELLRIEAELQDVALLISDLLQDLVVAVTL